VVLLNWGCTAALDAIEGREAQLTVVQTEASCTVQLRPCRSGDLPETNVGRRCVAFTTQSVASEVGHTFSTREKWR